MHLRTLVIVTNTDGTLATETLRPESTNVNVGLWDARVGEQEPCTEDGLGQDVEDGVGDDLLVNVKVAGSVSNAPDAAELSVSKLDKLACAKELTLGRRSR